MDKKWYRNLASSEYTSRGWILHQEAGFSEEQKLSFAMNELRSTAFEAVQIFNHHSSPESHITTLVMNNPDQSGVRGIMLLRYAFQLRMVREETVLLMTLWKTESYQHHRIAKTTLSFRQEDLGGIVWSTSKGQVWDVEQLVKHALKELVKLSQQARGGSESRI